MNVILGVESILRPPLTGVGHYTRHLLRGLITSADVDIRCMDNYHFVPPPLETSEDAVQLNGPPSLSRRIKDAASIIPGLQSAWLAMRAEQMRRRSFAVGDAIYHEPNHILRYPHKRSVVTVHDLSVLHYPQFHPADRVRHFEHYFATSARRANAIITDSEFIRQDMVRTLGVDPAKISVVPLGVGAEFRPMAAREVQPMLDKFGLVHNGYLLAVGTREPRKNLERLIEAYLDLPQELQTRFPLALAGPQGWRAEALERCIATLERDGKLRSLGYVSDDTRPALYNGAAGFAYPALYEGFGLPPLEAAACGTPVMTSQSSPMQETLGDVVELVDPLDTAAITKGLTTILADPKAKIRAMQEGVQHAQSFTWETCVKRTVEVYVKVEQD